LPLADFTAWLRLALEPRLGETAASSRSSFYTDPCRRIPERELLQGLHPAVVYVNQEPWDGVSYEPNTEMQDEPIGCKRDWSGFASSADLTMTMLSLIILKLAKVRKVCDSTPVKSTSNRVLVRQSPAIQPPRSVDMIP
jgi:hypothetical protein